MQAMLNLNFTPFPTLTTDRLVMRQLHSGDASELFFLRSDERVLKYVKRPPCQSLEEAAAFIERINDIVANNEGILWGITMKGSDTVIGNIAFWRIAREHDRAEIGYVLHPDYYNKNVMSEAVAAALDYGFTVMKLHSVEANTDPLNMASQRVLEKNGFVREAYFRENFYFEGKYLDSAVYCLVTPHK